MNNRAFFAIPRSRYTSAEPKANTDAQRALILRLLREVEFDTKVVTFQFRLLDAAEKWMGKKVADWLDSLDRTEASQVIAKLQGMAGSTDEDDDQ